MSTENPMAPDRLPPHDVCAEQAVLGCLLLLAADGLPAQTAGIRAVDERFGDGLGFYDLRHQTIFEAVRNLNATGTLVEPVALCDRLSTGGNLDSVGGHAYVGSLQDAIATVTELDHFLGIVHQKFLARQAIQFGTLVSNRAMQTGALTESSVVEYREHLGLLEKNAAVALVRAPKNLLPVSSFDSRVYEHFFERKDDTYGFPLPFPFPLRLRPHEMTWFLGEQGSGKSTMIGLIALEVCRHLKPGQKIIFASMEVPCHITLWIMVRQLMALGGHPERTEANIARVVKALAWLNERILLYDFLGITDWRELLRTFEFAREHQGGEFFIVDNFGRIGVPDDDYSLQDTAANAFFTFCIKTGAHLVMCDHENKGSGDGKQKIRGTGKKADHANNIVRILRNSDKAEKIAEVKAEVRAGVKTDKDLKDFIHAKRAIWDTKFTMLKQREAGTDQNASHWLYFDAATLQLRNDPADPPLDFFTPPAQ